MAATQFKFEGFLSFDGLAEDHAVSGPPGASGPTSLAPVGSTARDFTNGDLYIKDTVGTGSDKWERLARAEELGTSISWREPAEVRDNVATVLPTFTPGTDATVDGETITDLERVLFTNLTVNPNVYIYDKTAGVFNEDANLATAGDTVYIIRGTDAGRRFTFNDAGIWVLTDQASADELGFIRTYIGKPTAGSVTPLYTAENFITDGDDLTLAVDQLDIELGANVTNGEFILAANKINGNIQSLDSALADVNKVTTTLAVTGITTIDSVEAELVRRVTWQVQARNGNDIESAIIEAEHDGTAAASAVDFDKTVYAKGRINSPITGLIFTVDLDGAHPNQTLRLRGTATGATDFRVIRTHVLNF